MDKDDLLKELLYLKRARELERHRADLVTDREKLVRDLEKHRFGVFLRRYIENKINGLDYAIWDYNWQVTEQLNGCQTVQNELPSVLVLDSRYVDCAIDDVVMGRADSIRGLTELFERRKSAVKARSAAFLGKVPKDDDSTSMSRILSE